MATNKITKPPAQQLVSADTLSSSLVIDLITSGDWKNRKFVTAPQNPDETARRIALRDAHANSLDELLGGTETISGRDYLNKPFTILSVEWQQSELDDAGLPFYAVLHVSDINGEFKTITTGAITVVRKVAIIDAKGWLPATVKIVKQPRTSGGYEPLDLVQAVLDGF